MKNVLWVGLSFIVFSTLVGCGVSKPTSSNSLTGAVLGWNNNLYRITSSVNASNIGKKLGTETYHGTSSGTFTIFQLSGNEPTKGIVFEASDGHYYKAIITKSN